MQHSSLDWHEAPRAWQAQVPLRHIMKPQQSRSPVQPSPCCTQQRVELINRRHWPAQQGGPPMVQVAPRCVQELQTPPMQLSPEQQSVLLAQRLPRA